MADMNEWVDDTVATIACLFAGFEPNDYWKKAILEQHPEAATKAKAAITAKMQEIEREARIEAVKLLIETIESRGGRISLDLVRQFQAGQLLANAELSQKEQADE